MCYKFHFNLDEVLSFTQPQIQILQKNLQKILEAENPQENSKENSSKPSNEVVSQTYIFDCAVKDLKEKTGREQFTMAEVINKAETIKKYGIKKG